MWEDVQALSFVPFLFEAAVGKGIGFFFRLMRTRLVTSMVVKKVTMGLGAFIQNLKAMDLVVSLGLTSLGMVFSFGKSVRILVSGAGKIPDALCTKNADRKRSVEKCTKKRGISPEVAQIIR